MAIVVTLMSRLVVFESGIDFPGPSFRTLALGLAQVGMAGSPCAHPDEDSSKLAAIEPDTVVRAFIDDDAGSCAILPAIHQLAAGRALYVFHSRCFFRGFLFDKVSQAGQIDFIRARGRRLGHQVEFGGVEEQPEAFFTSLDDDLLPRGGDGAAQENVAVWADLS